MNRLLSAILIYLSLYTTTKIVSHTMYKLSLADQSTAQAAVQTPIRSRVNPDYECVVYDDQNNCYAWYNRVTGKYYNDKGQEIANPFP